MPAVTHSGMTLGPLVGAMVAEEVATGVQLGQLAPYRPTRDFGGEGGLLPGATDAWKELNAGVARASRCLQMSRLSKNGNLKVTVCVSKSRGFARLLGPDM